MGISFRARRFRDGKTGRACSTSMGRPSHGMLAPFDREKPRRKLAKPYAPRQAGMWKADGFYARVVSPFATTHVPFLRAPNARKPGENI